MAFTDKMVSLALLFILGVSNISSVSSRTAPELSITAKFEQWMAFHGRVYKDSYEKDERLQIFKKKVEHIDSHNAAPNRKYELGLNAFSDLTSEELKATRTGYKMKGTSTNPTSFKYENVSAVPCSIDWREKGAVTPIKNQGQCGCCWAFSAVAAMEGITQIMTGKLVSLSEQELVDCDTGGQDQGCEGGLMDSAFNFIQQNKGLNTESNYPYNGSDDGTCDKNEESSAAATINGHEDVPTNSEAALLKAVANQPVSVAIDASGTDFQSYKSGIFTGECGTALNHAVTFVGYGTSDDGTKYWLAKNSWGPSWGEDGYIRMQRDVDAKEGLCGIAMQASYPTA